MYSLIGLLSTITIAAAAPPPPTFSKFFAGQMIGFTTIPLNGTTTLTFTITNQVPGNVALTGVAFIDNFPAGLVVATPNALVGTCVGAVVANPGSGTVSLSGGALPAGGQCSITIDVTGTSAGAKTNVTGSISSNESGAGAVAGARIDVISPPTISKTFGASTIPLNGVTTLTFALGNPNIAAVFGDSFGFVDTLPAGLVVATPPAAGTCNDGTVTANAGSSTITLTGTTNLPGGLSCSFSVNVTGTSAGLKNNSVTAASVKGGQSVPSTASLTVISPPTLVKAFGNASVPLLGTTMLTFTLTNPNPTTLSGVGFSDALPAGLIVSTPNGLTGACGSGTITATAGASSILLAGASLAPSSSCTFATKVTATGLGSLTNVTTTVTSVEAGNGAPASASLVVTSPVATSIPALQEWTLALLGLLLALSVYASFARRGKRLP